MSFLLKKAQKSTSATGCKVSPRTLPIALLLCLFRLSPVTAEGPDAELVLRAFQHSYPGKISAVIFTDGDWTVRVDDKIFFWAGGRLLPAPLREKAESYSPHVFEVYPKSVPSPAIYSPRYVESLRLQGSAEARRNREDHNRDFQAALFGGLSRREIESRLENSGFLGKKIVVHEDIVHALKRIEAAIRKMADDDSAAGNNEISAFIASVGQVGAYNWREIRGTQRMSYHSWGLALDIQPKKLDGRAIYWLWERSRNDDWMLVPPENRWSPPERVIEAFEHEGFVWGGKWSLYDNMHFEYRPELHEIHRLLAASSSGVSPFDGAPPPASAQDLHHLYPGDIILRKRSGGPGSLFQ
ncbi:MAG: M15 family metallopeptidase [Treponema sp.]|nr:M15 family metallopeptidase [Treponema sp.]